MSDKVSTRAKSAAKKLKEAKVSLPTAPESSQSSRKKVVNLAKRPPAAKARRKRPASKMSPNSAAPAKKSSPSEGPISVNSDDGYDETPLSHLKRAPSPPPPAGEDDDCLLIETAKLAPLPPQRQVLASLDVLGTLTDSRGDGNCGYYATKSALQAVGFIQGEIGVVDYRKSIYDYVIENKSLFTGDSPSYTRIDGTASPAFHPLVRSGRSAAKNREKIFQREMRRIYQPGVAYLPSASHAHWMSDAVVPPILAFKYCITMVSFVGDTQTLIYRYDKKDRKVILEEHNGWVQPPPESVCIVGNGSDHFQWINPKT